MDVSVGEVFLFRGKPFIKISDVVAFLMNGTSNKITINALRLWDYTSARFEEKDLVEPRKATLTHEAIR